MSYAIPYDTEFCLWKLFVWHKLSRTHWLLCDFSNKSEEINLDDRPTFFLIWLYFYYDISYNARSHKNTTITLQQNWLYLKIVCLNIYNRKLLSELMTTFLVWSVFSIYFIQKKVTFQWYSHCNWRLAPWLQISQFLTEVSLSQPSSM